MRRVLIFTLTLALMLTTFFTTTALAESIEYDISEVGIKLSIPSDYIVITSTTPADAPIFEIMGVSGDDFLSLLKLSNVSMEALSDDLTSEIQLSVLVVGFPDLNGLSDYELDAFANGYTNGNTFLGMDILEQSVYTHAQSKFIVILASVQEQNAYCIQYVTILDGRLIGLSFNFFGSTTAEHKQIAQDIIDSLHINRAQAEVPTSTNTSPTVYTDSESGLSFTLPANWEEKPLNQDRQLLDAKFVNNTSTIVYGSVDMWGQMTALSRIGYDREDMDSLTLSTFDIAEMFGASVNDITFSTINDHFYYQFDTSNDVSAAGVNLTLSTRTLVCIDNGWLYMFQFGGESSGLSYDDFDTLLDSVVYP